MEHFTFGRNNGLRVSALALGAGMFGSRWGYGADQADIPKIFGRFADAGGTFIDTAASYQLGEAEENLDRLLDGRRDSFTIATKFAIGGPEGNGVLQTGNGRRAPERFSTPGCRTSRRGCPHVRRPWPNCGGSSRFRGFSWSTASSNAALTARTSPWRRPSGWEWRCGRLSAVGCCPESIARVRWAGSPNGIVLSTPKTNR